MTNLSNSQTTQGTSSKTNTAFRIPFNKPYCAGDELKNIVEAISLGHISGDGKFTRACSTLLEELLEAHKVFITTSCTHALEMAALLLDLAPGDEVLVPSFTFVSTINAFALRGAVPKFVDIRQDTLNMDHEQIASLVTEKTKAIFPVHYAGVGCEMGKLMSLAQEYNLKVVEDNAHGLFGKYKGNHLGSFGDMSTLSFHETKNISCGEGGALVVNNKVYEERAEIIREKGTNRSCFFRGQVDKYSWVDIGSSYLPSDILSAYLFAQLEARQSIQATRQHIWNTYSQSLATWAAENSIRLPYVPEDCDQAYHMFYLIMPSLEARQQLIAHLKSHGILSVYHYLPLHSSKMGLKYGQSYCPNTDYISERLLRLPFYNGMVPFEQEQVIEAVLQFSC